MRNWVEQMTGAGAEMIEAEGIIANEAPDADAQAACEAAGKELTANASVSYTHLYHKTFFSSSFFTFRILHSHYHFKPDKLHFCGQPPPDLPLSAVPHDI